jgi:hypothetical protein
VPVKGPFRSSADALGFGLFALAVVAGLTLLAQRALLAPDGRFIVQDAAAPWIMAPLPFSAKIRQWGRERAPRTLFVLRFEPEPGSPTRLAVRTFGAGRVLLNGEELPLRTGGARWKWMKQLDVSEWVVPGENRLRVEVHNLYGPGLLSARVESGGRTFVSDPSWKAAVAGRKRRAALFARDVMVHPDADKFVPPHRALLDRLPTLVLVFACFAGLWHWGGGRVRALDSGRRERFALAALALVWLAFGVRSFWPLDPIYGFDARKHLEYLHILLDEGRLPLATEGWSTYHPPLFYALAALCALPGEWLGSDTLGRAIKLPAFLAGLGLAWQTLRLARRLLPAEGLARPAAMLFAGLLPMNVYVAASFSNEALLAFLCAGALVAAVDALREPEPDPRTLALLSLWLGLALLTKYTAIVLLGVVVVFVGGRLVWRARIAPAAALRGAAALLAPMLVVSGWYYARNLAVYGQPVVGNWALPDPGQVWWSPPGFHTIEYYTSFGESLVRPYFAAFASFWDTLYSTVWGDGLLGGAGEVAGRNPQWRYAWMSAGYGLALAFCVLVGVGSVALLWRTLRSPDDAERRSLALLVVFVCAMLFAVLYTTLALPYYGQAKAFYALSTVPVFAIAFGAGYGWLDGRLESEGAAGARTVLLGGVATVFTVFAVSYL